MRKTVVHYDKNGKSLGIANIFFERRVDALKLVKAYNGMHLDGRFCLLRMSYFVPLF